MKNLASATSLKVLLVVTAVLLTFKLLFAPPLPKPPHPHIVFIVADDLGWNDVSWQNPQIRTPNLEKFARAGVILNASYVPPICSPSRASFMTGYYAHRTGLQHIPIIHFKEMYLPSRFTLLPELLKEKGYATHLVGKWHLGFCNWRYTPRYRGFDTFLGYYGGQEGYYNHTNGKVEEGYDLRDNEDVLPDPDMEYGMYIFTRKAVQLIEEHNRAQSMFLFVSFQSVHSPVEAPERFVDLHPDMKHPTRRIFSGMVSVLDEAFGNVTAALERRGMLDNTLLIFVSDNGGSPDVGGNNWPLRGGKFSLWEGGTRVPAFVYSKDLINQPGSVNNEFIHAVDWFPTMLSAAGVQPDEHIDGISQLDTLRNGSPSLRKEFIYNIDEIDQNAAIRVGDYKLMKGEPGRFFEWYPVPEEENEVLPTQYPTWKRRPWTPRMFPDYQLYNIKEDPEERHDLAEQLPHVVERLKKKLGRYESQAVPSQNPRVEPRSLPHNFGGVWTPGWCE